jgi:hypothetical protein
MTTRYVDQDPNRAKMLDPDPVFNQSGSTALVSVPVPNFEGQAHRPWFNFYIFNPPCYRYLYRYRYRTQLNENND